MRVSSPAPFLLCPVTWKKLHFLTSLSPSFFLGGMKFQIIHLSHLGNLVKKMVIDSSYPSTRLIFKAPLLLCDIHTVTGEERGFSPPVAAGVGVLAISRENEFSENCTGGCHLEESFLCMERHSWVSKVPLPLVQS